MLPGCGTWDKGEGDATFMKGVPDEHYDWVHSSHCLEHLQDPVEGMKNWLRILKPHGYLICTVPDWYLYEQYNWPSIYNRDHKWAFSLALEEFQHVICVPEFLSYFNVRIHRMQLNDSGYAYSKWGTEDQTRGDAQAEIEIIIRKL